MATNKKVGISGGGQLGRMSTHPAASLGVDSIILDKGGYTPAKQTSLAPQGSEHIDGAFTSEEHIRKLAKECDVLTVEIEHVNADVLAAVEAEGSCEVQPAPATIRLIQDKYSQHKHLRDNGIPTAPFAPLDSREQKDVEALAKELGLPLMLKARTLAYDGRGNAPLKTTDAKEVAAALEFSGDRPSYAEGWAPFVKEVAVMVVRNKHGEVKSYDAVETVHRDSISRVCTAPLRADGPEFDGINAKARALAERAVATLDGAGIFGVEMFLLADGSLLLNEIAPRPHNSGHHTIEACTVSQFENHSRAILDSPSGDTSLRVPSAAMINILGVNDDMAPVRKMVQDALAVDGASAHSYGKADSRKARKMGHITVTAPSDAESRARMRTSLSQQPDLDEAFVDSIAPAPKQGLSNAHPLVGIIMGSDSDLPVMSPATKILDQFNIPYELTITSAHRTPDRMVKYARSAASRGLRAVIAGAGGAAHLPGMVASETSVPVIGVPVKASVLDGVDSLYSIVQMPRGIPCATVGINNSTNAALLAVRILGTSVPEYQRAMEKYQHDLEEEVLAKADTSGQIGWDRYVAEKSKK